MSLLGVSAQPVSQGRLDVSLRVSAKLPNSSMIRSPNLGRVGKHTAEQQGVAISRSDVGGKSPTTKARSISNSAKIDAALGPSSHGPTGFVVHVDDSLVPSLSPSRWIQKSRSRSVLALK